MISTRGRYALRVLIDLAENDNGNYIQTEKSVTTGNMDATPVAVRGMHRQMGEFALDAIEGVEQDKRHFSGITLADLMDAPVGDNYVI